MDITDEELAEMEDRVLFTGHISAQEGFRLIAALRASRAEVERLRGLGMVDR